MGGVGISLFSLQGGGCCTQMQGQLEFIVCPFQTKIFLCKTMLGLNPFTGLMFIFLLLCIGIDALKPVFFNCIFSWKLPSCCGKGGVESFLFWYTTSVVLLELPRVQYFIFYTEWIILVLLLKMLMVLFLDLCQYNMAEIALLFIIYYGLSL